MARKQIDLKYTFTCDPQDLYAALHQPATLRNWIAERVEFDENLDIYLFYWADIAESVRMIEQNAAHRTLKWVWMDGDYQEGEYTRFRVGDADDSRYVDLYIEDFCEDSDEEQQRSDWDEHMKRLARVVS